MLTSVTLSVKIAAEIARLTTVLCYRFLVRLVSALETEGFFIATTFFVNFCDVTFVDCYYYLKALKDEGVIELVHSRPVRGATERFYSLAPRSHWPGAQRLRDFVDLLLQATSLLERKPAAAVVT